LSADLILGIFSKDKEKALKLLFTFPAIENLTDCNLQLLGV